MREIKFRGWHSKMNRMFYAEEMEKDQMTLLPTGKFINVHGGSTALSVIYPPDKFIPLQFTGLKDKNGKEIYEGDILTHHYFHENGIVIWHTKQSRWALEYYDKSTQELFPIDFRIFEIIGNIYENPELLKNS